MSSAMGSFCWGLKNEIEKAVVNEPSVFEPLKFYCNLEYKTEWHAGEMFKTVTYSKRSKGHMRRKKSKCKCVLPEISNLLFL